MRIQFPRAKGLLACFVILFILVGCGDKGEEEKQPELTYKHMNQKAETLGSVTPPPRIKNHELITNQEIDTFGGPAALTTVLKYTFKRDIAEEMVRESLLSSGDEAQAPQTQAPKKGAVSLLDMKKFLKQIGFTGTGYKITEPISYEQMKNDNFDSFANRMITTIELNNYRYFVIFRGFDQEFVYLGDPSHGNICLSINDFSKALFNNAVFVIEEEAAAG